jgi:hypothetical protein
MRNVFTAASGRVPMLVFGLVVAASTAAVAQQATPIAFHEDPAETTIVPIAAESTTVSPLLPAPADTGRPRVVEYSDWYARRLTIHRLGSYVMLPLFGAEYLLGQRLINGTNVPGWVKPAHVAVAYGVGALFVSNTVTGLWNAWDARHDPADRTRRYLHAALMLGADAGFAYTGTIAGDAKRTLAGRDRHRNAALISMGISTAGTALMWFWRD